MKWFEESRAQIMRRSIVERGILFTVREVFNNNAFVLLVDADEVFGKEWEKVTEGLRKTGLLEVIRGKKFVQMSVHLPGDKKREYMKRHWRSKKEKKNEEA